MTQEPPGHRRTAGTSKPRRDEFVDFYELLEISPRASQEVIQAAYRVLARAYHPDMNSTAEAPLRIRQLNAAYKVLSDPQNRACYDLQCLRAHRFERLIQPDASGVGLRPPGAGRARALPPRPPAVPPLDERFAMRHGSMVVGLIVAAAVAAIILVLIATGVDAPADYNSVLDRPTINMTQR